MITKEQFSGLLDEHQLLEVSVVTPTGQQSYTIKPNVRMLNEGHNPSTEFVLFDDNTKSFVEFDFHQIRGVSVKY